MHGQQVVEDTLQLVLLDASVLWKTNTKGFFNWNTCDLCFVFFYILLTSDDFSNPVLCRCVLSVKQQQLQTHKCNCGKSMWAHIHTHAHTHMYTKATVLLSVCWSIMWFSTRASGPVPSVWAVWGREAWRLWARWSPSGMVVVRLNKTHMKKE